MDNGEGLNLPNLNRLFLYVKRRLKLNRFLLVIDTKKGVVISAITIIVSIHCWLAKLAQVKN